MNIEGVVTTIPQCISLNTCMEGGSYRSIGEKMVESSN
jgi:hypothetical protein